MQEHRLHRGWLGGAVVCAAAVIGSSPYIGDIRSAILAAFPTQFRLIIGGAIATAVIAAIVDPPACFSIPLVRRVLRPIAYGVSVVLLAFAGFFHAVHFGHQVYEPDIGVVWSHYDAQTLLAESTDRANRWRSNPPTEM